MNSPTGRRTSPAASEAHLHEDLPITSTNPISSPIHRLSDDVLILIFSELLRLSEYLDPPWECSVVCRRWRELTISCPLLWSYIELHARGSTEKPQLYHSRIETQLARTAAIPLEKIMFDLRGPIPASDTRTARLLLQHLHKTKLLHLEGDVSNDFLPDIPPVFSALTELYIFHESWMKPGLFQHTPALETLRIEGLTVQQPFALQWGNLIQLELLNCEISASRLLSILHLTPHLVILRIFTTLSSRQDEQAQLAHSEPDSMRRPIIASLELEKLTDLDIRHETGDYKGGRLQSQLLLSHLQAPNLEGLAIIGASDETIEAAIHFIRSSQNGHRISDVFLDNFEETDVHPILELLKELPELQILYLGSYVKNFTVDPILHALQWHPEPEDTGHSTCTVPDAPDALNALRICPELIDLSFSRVSITAAVLVNAVKGRILAFPGDEGDGLPPCFMESLELWDVSFAEGDLDTEKRYHPIQPLLDAAKLGLIRFDIHFESDENP